MAPYGGFDHNAQTLRILTRLERRYAEFDGLNLTWETLEGVVKHNGPLTRAAPANATACRRRSPNTTRRTTSSSTPLPAPEAQVAALADDIAYNNHDIDDGLRAGLFASTTSPTCRWSGRCSREVARRYPGLEHAAADPRVDPPRDRPHGAPT